MGLPMVLFYGGNVIPEIRVSYSDLDEAAERAVLDNTRRLRNLGYEIGVEQGVFPPPDVKVPPSVLKGVSQEIDLFYLDQRARHMRNN